MSLIYTRIAKEADLNEIMVIISNAKQFLKNAGSSQWQNGYPTGEDILQDIKQKHGFVLIVDGKIAGYCATIVGIEPTYLDIKGEWHNESDPYATIHRMAIAREYRGQHLASFLLSDIISIFGAQKITNFRIDTSKQNQIVQHLATTHNFKRRGIISVSEDPINPERLAFELNL